MPATERVLTEEMIEAIQAYLPRYPTKQAVTLPALHIVNSRLRHVPIQAVIEIAELLELAPAQVQDTLTFYQFFKQQEAHGKVRAWVCRSLSCSIRGGEEMLEQLCHLAGIPSGGTTPDGALTVEPAECLGACDFAPCMLANDTLHKDLTPEKLEAFLREVQESAESTAE